MVVNLRETHEAGKVRERVSLSGKNLFLKLMDLSFCEAVYVPNTGYIWAGLCIWTGMNGNTRRCSDSIALKFVFYELWFCETVYIWVHTWDCVVYGRDTWWCNSFGWKKVFLWLEFFWCLVGLCSCFFHILEE